MTKEKKILKNLLAFLKPYEKYSIMEEEPGVYKFDNALSLKLPNVDFAQFSRKKVTVNLNDESVSFHLSNYGNESRAIQQVALIDHINDIIEQMTQRAKRQLDYNVEREDSDRLRKSRDCRVNRRLMSVIETT